MLGRGSIGVLYHGMLAPHCGWRARAVAYGAPPAVASSCSEAPVASGAAPRHWAWAALMRRGFDVDVLACPRCGGRLRLIATVEDPAAIEAILAAVSCEEAGRAPPRAAARLPTARRRAGPERTPDAAVAEVCSRACWRRPMSLDRRAVLVETP
jgi:hypothetical protein